MEKIKFITSILLFATISLPAIAQEKVLYQYSYGANYNFNSIKVEKAWPFNDQDIKELGEEVVKKGIEFCKTDKSVLFIEERFNHYIKNHPGAIELSHWGNVYVDNKICTETPTLLTCKAHAVSCHPILTSKDKRYYITVAKEPAIFRGLKFKKKCESIRMQALEDPSVMSAEVVIGEKLFSCGVDMIKLENR
jgi:hypothetical protein